MVVSLGPKGVIVTGIPKNPRFDGLGSNPRCLRRDVNKYSAAGATANYTYSLIMDNPKIDDFYNRYLGQPPLQNDLHPWGVCHSPNHARPFAPWFRAGQLLCTWLTVCPNSFTTPATISLAVTRAAISMPVPATRPSTSTTACLIGEFTSPKSVKFSTPASNQRLQNTESGGSGR